MVMCEKQFISEAFLIKIYHYNLYLVDKLLYS